MANHLPECTHDTRVNDWCICDRLRQAEQRVTDRHNAEHEDDRLGAFENGYAAGMTACRDAVAALNPRYVMYPDRFVRVSDALAAIDKLRGETND